MAKSRFTKDTPTCFKNMSPEKFEEIRQLALAARERNREKRKEMQEWMDFIGNSTVKVDGIDVPRNFLVIYKLYEKAMQGNEKAIKILLDANLKTNMPAEVIANIIKLKIE